MVVSLSLQNLLNKLYYDPAARGGSARRLSPSWTTPVPERDLPVLNPMLKALHRRWPPGHSRARPLVALAGWRGSLLALALAVGGPGGRRGDAAVADTPGALILKILTYDRHFESRFGDGAELGILYAPADPRVREGGERLLGHPVQYAGQDGEAAPGRRMLVEFTTPENLERSIATRNIDVLYVAPGNAQEPRGHHEGQPGAGRHDDDRRARLRPGRASRWASACPRTVRRS